MNIGLPIVAGRMALQALGRLTRGIQAEVDEPTLDRPALFGTDQADRLAALRRLGASYDLEWISPKEFSNLVHQLYQLQVLSGEQFRELAVLRMQWDAEGLDPERPINVLEHCAEQVRLLRESARRNSAAADQDGGGEPPESDSGANSQVGAELGLSAVAVADRQLRSLERIAWLLSNPEKAGLDQMA